jgi:chemotaxis protein MotA
MFFIFLKPPIYYSPEPEAAQGDLMAFGARPYTQKPVGGNMNLATVIGLPLGFVLLVFAYIMDGGNVASLVLPTPFIIIIGGTFSALLTSFDLADVLAIPKLMGAAMKNTFTNESELGNMFVGYADKSRRDGLLSLEEEIQSLDEKHDPLIKKGLRYVIDGTDSDALSELLENDVAVWEKHKKHEIAIFEAAGGFSPTMGIIGTVLGLVIVLSHLSEPEKLGESIATAFIATLYGISFANLIWLPIANKLKLKLEKEKRVKEMIIQGVLAIQQGESPKFVGDKLAVYLPEKDRSSLESFNEA